MVQNQDYKVNFNQILSIFNEPPRCVKSGVVAMENDTFPTNQF